MGEADTAGVDPTWHLAEVSAAALSPREGALWVLAGRLAMELDQRMVEAITARWGPYWQMGDLCGRLQRYSPVGSQREAWMLDGQLLVEFGEPVLSERGGVFVLTRSCVRYRYLEA